MFDLIISIVTMILAQLFEQAAGSQSGLTVIIEFLNTLFAGLVG